MDTDTVTHRTLASTRRVLLAVGIGAGIVALAGVASLIGTFSDLLHRTVSES
jgi:hypothetical protein